MYVEGHGVCNQLFIMEQKAGLIPFVQYYTYILLIREESNIPNH